MSSISRSHQWGGLAFMLGNGLFLANKVNEMSRLFLARSMPDLISGQNTLLILLGQVALIMGYVAYYRFYVQRVGRAGKNALRLFSGGGITLAVGHGTFSAAVGDRLPYAESLFFLVIIGLSLLLIGLIWFGILNLRQPILAQWPWLPLATGLTGLSFPLFGGEEITAIFLLFRTLFALGLVGLGYILWLGKPIRHS